MTGYSHHFVQRHEEETAGVVCRLAAIVSVTAARNQYGVQHEYVRVLISLWHFLFSYLQHKENNFPWMG
jgi:hypothetical protein